MLVVTVLLLTEAAEDEDMVRWRDPALSLRWVSRLVLSSVLPFSGPDDDFEGAALTLTHSVASLSILSSAASSTMLLVSALALVSASVLGLALALALASASVLASVMTSVLGTFSSGSPSAE